MVCEAVTGARERGLRRRRLLARVVLDVVSSSSSWCLRRPDRVRTVESASSPSTTVERGCGEESEDEVVARYQGWSIGDRERLFEE